MTNDIAALIAELPRKQRRGSLPRCLLLTEGTEVDVAARLNRLLDGHAMIDPLKHAWGPRGLSSRDEHQLHNSSLLEPAMCAALGKWWFAVESPLARSPTWDLVAQASIGGRQGLVLVEAKAHASELKTGGKRKTGTSNEKNHERIGKAIDAACAELEKLRPGWNISAGSHYQLANRFAWAWRLASGGTPVVLVYLGFTGADEMQREGDPIRDDDHWSQLLDTYGKDRVPADIWESPLDIGGVPLIALRRTLAISLPAAVKPQTAPAP